MVMKNDSKYFGDSLLAEVQNWAKYCLLDKLAKS